MAVETIVAVYDVVANANANAAVRDLEAVNMPSSAISRQAGTPTTMVSSGMEPVREKGFWSSLFGGEPDHDEAVYDHSLSSGSSVVTVKVPTEHVQQVSAILERHNPIDMDERAASYGAAMSSTATTMATIGLAAAPVQTKALQAGDKEVLALSEEQLAVGKRLVNRGTSRIRRFVVETPVEEAVTLRSENISIERRPVAADTKASDVAFTERTFEVTETDEEAVVVKTARVKEEILINKAATERIETVHDTVRHEDVEIIRDEQATTKTGVTEPLTPKTQPRI